MPRTRSSPGMPAGAEIRRRSEEVDGSRRASNSRRCQPDTQAKLKDLMKGVNKSWADALDARGKKGSDALKEFEAAVAAVPAK